jgi:hypothetical protein
MGRAWVETRRIRKKTALKGDFIMLVQVCELLAAMVMPLSAVWQIMFSL